MEFFIEKFTLKTHTFSEISAQCGFNSAAVANAIYQPFVLFKHWMAANLVCTYNYRLI